MNYLAHFHLAEQLAELSDCNKPGLLIGALLGDYVKGPLKAQQPAEWERGIWLHRRIDAVTDQHPLVQDCLASLPREYRRFGGIMLDVAFDHCLARRWCDFDPRPLSQFSQHCYATVQAQQQHFPQAAQRQIAVLAKHDVLSMMVEWSPVEKMLAGIGRRLRVDNPLHRCGPDLLVQMDKIETRFQALYPQLLHQLSQELSDQS